jgi:hypothetical protein
MRVLIIAIAAASLASRAQYDAQQKTALQGPAAAALMNEDGHAAIIGQPGQL